MKLQVKQHVTVKWAYPVEVRNKVTALTIHNRAIQKI
jgi:hypothetical protein